MSPDLTYRCETTGDSSRAVVSLCHGDPYRALSHTSFPYMRQYAERVGADFVTIEYGGAAPWPHFAGWLKLGLHAILQRWPRALFLDCDVLIDAARCPDLFDLVPATHLGVHNEGRLVPRGQDLRRALDHYGLAPPDGVTYDGSYFNTGVMVLSAAHQPLFEWPAAVHDAGYWEQSLVNARAFARQIPVKELTYRFNRMNFHDHVTGQERHGSYIIHYAGAPDDLRGVADAMVSDAARFGTPAMTRLICRLRGDLSDQTAAEPMLRHMIERVYPRETTQFSIVTDFSRAFAHLEADNVRVGPVPHAFAGDGTEPVAEFDLTSWPFAGTTPRPAAALEF